MNPSWLPMIAVVVVLTVCIGAAAWWQHRRYVAQLQHRLDYAEAARTQLVERTTELDQRLALMKEVLSGQQEKLLVASDLDERRETLERALAQTPSTPAHWQETQPFSGGDSSMFALTQPPEAEPAERATADAR